MVANSGLGPRFSNPHSVLSATPFGLFILVLFTMLLLVLLSRFSRVRLFVTPWTAAHQAPPSMGFFRQECWSGVPLPSPGKPYIHVYICVYILFHTLSHYGLSQDIEHSSLCSAVGSCLSILCILVCIYNKHLFYGLINFHAPVEVWISF